MCPGVHTDLLILSDEHIQNVRFYISIHAHQDTPVTHSEDWVVVGLGIYSIAMGTVDL